MARVVALLLVCLAGCAGGTEDDTPDAAMTVDAQAAIDSPPAIDADLTADGPNLSIGETCTDPSQCASNICVISGDSGYCSEICTQGSCPPGYGCYGVLGAIEPGEVANVCVKETNLLCTVCAQNEDCSMESTDLCLPSSTGGSFCARDCSVIQCPGGYLCTDVTVGETTYKQCLPASTACDCNMTNAGAKKACDIETPFGSCAGSRTCLGGAGWSECTPPSGTDEPDGTFTDNNCDGIDGTAEAGIFVAAGGANGATCGTSFQEACKTLSFGAQRAVETGRSWLFVQAGDYPETVVLQSGVHVAGGYDASWQRAPRTEPGHATRIIGQTFEDEAIAVVARELAAQTRILDVAIQAPPASGSRVDLWAARSSYGVHAVNANLRLDRVTIVAARGAEGARGANGNDAPNVSRAPAMNGTKGDNAGDSD